MFYVCNDRDSLKLFLTRGTTVYTLIYMFNFYLSNINLYMHTGGLEQCTDYTAQRH